MELKQGTRVNERLRLVRPLGRGGMGSVWVAHHETLDIEVAVKFIAPELAATLEPIVLTRFKREAQLAAKLDGPNVVRVLDHGVTVDDVPYIVMEMLRGESLGERFQAKKTLAAEDVARIVTEVADGLASAHELGIVHRDIKPQNIFLAKTRGGQEVAKILDFGIARLDDSADARRSAPSATASGTLVGTPLYMSPEQLLEAKGADKSADLWALAVVAYEGLTGRHPFAAETTAGTMTAITRGAFARASTGTQLPKDLDAFFERALSPDRAARFTSAGELSRALCSALLSASPSGAADGGAGAEGTTGDFVRDRGLSVALADTVSAAPSTGGTSRVGTTTDLAIAPRVGKVWFAIGGAAICILAGTAYVLYTHGSSSRSTGRGSVVAATDSVSASSNAVTSSDASAQPSASSVAVPQLPLLLPCPDGTKTGCDASARAWCDASNRLFACCGPGLAPVDEQRCACPPGGTQVQQAIDAGCASSLPDPQKVQSVVRKNFSEIRACYARGIEKNPKLRGSLSVHFEIAPDGRPGRIGLVDASAPDPEFQDCVIRIVSGLRFQPPVDGYALVTYPLHFEQGE